MSNNDETNDIEPKIWKLDKKSINNLQSKKTYAKVISFWLRTYWNANIELDSQFINLIALFLQISAYKSSFSTINKSKAITVSNDGLSFHVNDEIDNKHFAVIKCDDSLPHGLITEFTFYLPYISNIVYMIGVINHKFNNFSVYKKRENILNFWGISDKSQLTESQLLSYQRQYYFFDGGFSSIRAYEQWLCPGFTPNWPSSWSNHDRFVFNNITVRVNLSNYLLSFWTERCQNDEPLCIAKNNYSDYHPSGSIISRRGGPPKDYAPIVFDLPKNQDFKWYPVIFVNHQLIKPDNVRVVFEE
eukprot:24947_1